MKAIMIAMPQLLPLRPAPGLVDQERLDIVPVISPAVPALGLFLCDEQSGLATGD
jgi:hypothetical protein